MSETKGNGAAHPQSQWRQLCEAAVLELDPTKLIERIAEARTAVLGRIEDGLSVPSEGERFALDDALDMLIILQDIAERDIDDQQTGT
jgi:hypothetical protein